MASRKSAKKLQLLEHETLTPIIPIPAWDEMAPDHSMQDARTMQSAAKSYSSVVPKNEGGDQEPPSCNAWDNYIPGTIFNDNLVGGNAKDDIFGNHGHDTLSGAGGNDLIRGGSGNDLIYGGSGDDRLHGEDVGNPTTLGSDTMYGGIGNDYVSGDLGNDVLNGGDGDDTVWGDDGCDCAGGGNDTLYGGGGNDWLWGGGGNDRMDGGLGDDQFWFDVLGSPGHDTIENFQSGLSFGGRDTLHFFGISDTDGIVGIDYRDLDALLDADGDGAVTAADDSIINGGAGGDVTFHFAGGNLTLTFVGYGEGNSGSFAINSISDVVNPNYIEINN